MPRGQPAAPITSFTRSRSSRTCRSRSWRAAYPEARRTPHELAFRCRAAATSTSIPFGAIVFRDVAPAERDAEIARLRAGAPRPDQRHGHRGVHGPRGSGQQGDMSRRRADHRQADPGARERHRADRRAERRDGILRAHRRGDVRAHRSDRRSAGGARLGPVSHPPAAPVHRRRHQHAQRGAHRSCTCSTSPTKPGTTRAWTASTTSCAPSSTWSIATRRWSSSCAASRRRWSWCSTWRAIAGWCCWRRRSCC